MSEEKKDGTETTALAVKPEATLAADGVKRYEEKRDYFVELSRSTLKSVLTMHWERGEFANELATRPGHYGNSTLDKLASDLDMSRTAIDYDHRVFLRCSRGELDYYVNKDITWTIVCSLLTLEDERTRKGMADKFKKDKMTYEQLDAVVKDMTAEKVARKKSLGQKVDSRSGANPTRTFSSADSLCEGTENKLGEVKDALRDFGRCEDKSRRSVMAAALKESRKSMVSLQKKLEATIRDVDRALEG